MRKPSFFDEGDRSGSSSRDDSCVRISIRDRAEAASRPASSPPSHRKESGPSPLDLPDPGTIISRAVGSPVFPTAAIPGVKCERSVLRESAPKSRWRPNTSGRSRRVDKSLHRRKPIMRPRRRSERSPPNEKMGIKTVTLAASRIGNISIVYEQEPSTQVKVRGWETRYKRKSGNINACGH